MEFVKVDKSFCDNLFKEELAMDNDVYILKKDTIVGYGFIKNDKKGTLYFHILEEYRGNGYGSVLFHNLLSVLKKGCNYKEIELSVKKDDLRSNRIIKRCGGVEVIQKDDKINYVVPLTCESA